MANDMGNGKKASSLEEEKLLHSRIIDNICTIGNTLNIAGIYIVYLYIYYIIYIILHFTLNLIL